MQQSRELAESFRLFAPTADPSYSPVLGARNKLASIEKSADGDSLTMVWKSLQVNIEASRHHSQRNRLVERS